MEDALRKLERAFIRRGFGPTHLRIYDEAVVALKTAVLAEARPQWRKQVAEEIRRERFKRHMDAFEVAEFVERGGEK